MMPLTPEREAEIRAFDATSYMCPMCCQATPFTARCAAGCGFTGGMISPGPLVYKSNQAICDLLAALDAERRATEAALRRVDELRAQVGPIQASVVVDQPDRPVSAPCALEGCHYADIAAARAEIARMTTCPMIQCPFEQRAEQAESRLATLVRLAHVCRWHGQYAGRGGTGDAPQNAGPCISCGYSQAEHIEKTALLAALSGDPAEGKEK